MILSEVDLYKNLYLQGKTPTCVLSPEGKILLANPAHEKLFAANKCLLVGHSFSGCIGADQWPTLLDKIHKGEHFHQDLELTKPDGKKSHVDISASGVEGESGEILAIIIISRDHTQRRESDNQLIRFHNMLDQSNDAFLIIDVETGQIIDVNKRACNHYGYNQEEMLQLSIVNINSGYQGIDKWRQRVDSIQKNQDTLFETTHITKSRKIFPVEVSHRYVEDDNKDYIIAIARDISERKAAEEKERQAQREWSRTFDSSTDIITIQNLKHEITQSNQAAAVAFGLNKDECIGKYCYELFSGNEEPCSDCPITEEVSDNFKPYTEEFYHKRLDKTFSLTVSPIMDDTGQTTGISHFAKDITQQKKLEGQLRQAQKMESLGTLAGGIAHDFNNILSAIIGYTQLAMLHTPQDSKALDSLKQVTTGGQRAVDLVKQILTFSRKTENRMAPIEVQRIITETLKLLRPSLPMTIEIRQNIDQNCPPVLADAVQVHQVIMNLCTNAYHAMSDQNTGTLEISLTKIDIQPEMTAPLFNLQAGEYLLLQVSDTGIGMGSATLEKIFEPYFTTKKTGEGTGLGLAVAHGIIKDFGGHISVYSELDEGTCFNIYLPVPAGQTQTIQEPSTPIEAPLGTERLLIIDDEKPIADLLKVTLESYGYQVTKTTESPEALRIFKQAPELFDMVITDYAMPQMNGIDLAEELLKVRKDLPILLCTGFNDTNNNSKALQIGIKTCMNKPIQSDQLALAVRKFLDKA